MNFSLPDVEPFADFRSANRQHFRYNPHRLTLNSLIVSNMALSLNQIAHSRLRFPAWLGIFAILMLFVAPLVSKTLVAQGVALPMMPMMAGMEMPAMADTASPTGIKSAIADSTTDHMPGMTMPDRASENTQHLSPNMSLHITMSAGDMMDAACGYCVLLMHLPLLVMLALTVLCSRASVVQPSPPRVVACPHQAPIFKDSQPRAPPVPGSVVLPFKA